ncbi:long-chain-alcohol oxidase FAO4A-like [Macadamia integrifolia]|uniref:long-chain-alcohol oxidase FAO4A-like n=1 Tax=Macadamia integrifolia TaxID=60698 RepID=UPI001C4E64AA|nr:long-chain-alcohol oxidase FAO4A-like [Macadamia integrifolia]
MEHEIRGQNSMLLMEGEVEHSVIELNEFMINPVPQSKPIVNLNRIPHVKLLSSRQMESLSFICETFLPSINLSGNGNGNGNGNGKGNVVNDDDGSIHTYYKTSASMAGTHEHVEVMIAETLKHPLVPLLLISLWMLSTWFGTFLLCGTATLSTRFPYFHKFSQLPQKKREQIFLSWSLSFFYPLRMLFRALKYLTMLAFFSQVDENNHNLCWKALGYCGPDPDFTERSQETERTQPEGEGNRSKDGDEENFVGPLDRGLVDVTQPREVLSATLEKLGFPVSLHHRSSIKTPPSLSSPSLTIQCDVVVVGSGSGGGVVAGVLAKAGYKVLVLEKGNYHARRNLSLLEGPSMDQMYQNNGLLVTNDMGVTILAGSTVGGGSTINWSASIRTPGHIIKEWCNTHELELFDSKLYEHAMDVVCERMGVQSNIKEEGFNNAVLRKGCNELGYPVNNIPRNSTSDHYCGWCCFGCKDGRKKGTSETWLVDLVESGNGVILPGCTALKVLHERTQRSRCRNTATGVAFQFNNGWGKDVCVVKSKVTIVACGALSTPTLLKKSGLRNPNIGKHLHLHPVAMAWGYFPNSSNGCPKLQDKKSYEGSIMTAMSTVVANFEVSSDGGSGGGYGAVIQTPALHPGMFSALIPWLSGIDIKERMCKFSRTAHIFALARDKGSGTVNSSNSYSYQMDDIDEENLRKGLEKILRIMAAAGAEEIGTHHCDGKKLNVKEASWHEFERFVKEESKKELRGLSTPICSAHQMGSCRMGVDPNESVVNQRGETWEVEGLFLADTSVFPTALGVNPMVTVQSIAYCTAHSVLDVLWRKKSRN